MGRIVSITMEGRASVDFPGNVNGPIEARSIVSASCDCFAGCPSVLLYFEQGDPAPPVILGIVRDCVYPGPGGRAPAISPEIAPPQRIDLGAQEGIGFRSAEKFDHTS